MKDGQLRVWWVPQMPMESFVVNVATVDEGVKILDVLADYDLFQFKQKVKPDYSNTGRLELYEDEGWTDWYSHEFDDLDEYITWKEKNNGFRF